MSMFSSGVAIIAIAGGTAGTVIWLNDTFALKEPTVKALEKIQEDINYTRQQWQADQFLTQISKLGGRIDRNGRVDCRPASTQNRGHCEFLKKQYYRLMGWM